MTETELQEIESRLPKGASRLGTNVDACQLATEVRGAWGEGVELRQRLNDARDTSARVVAERDEARGQSARYRAERDELVDRCSALRQALAALVVHLPPPGGGDAERMELLAKARHLLQPSNG